MKSRFLLAAALLVPVAVSSAQTPGQAPAPTETAGQPGTPSDQTKPAPISGTSSDTYVIGASDILTVTVWKDQTLSGNLLVRPDGMISMPLLGDLQAAGLTPLQLSNQIAAKLKKYMQDPNVSVVLNQIHSKVIYLLGQVAKTGPVDMTPGMTLLQAISTAGGLTDYANPKKMYVLRDESGKKEKIPVHYKEALKGNSELDIALKPGDTIVVP